MRIVYDQQIEVGEKWSAWIDREVRGADFLLVLISASSIRSDMVREEIKIAHEQALQRNGSPKIILIRVDYTGDLPYDLGAYLNPLQYALWTEATGIDAIVNKLLPVILKDDASLLEPPVDSGSEQGQGGLFSQTAALGAPLPSADYLLESGAMKPDSPFYVKRTFDDMLFTYGMGKGVTIVIKGPRQVGKSSLLAQFCAEVRNRGASCLILDFQTIDEGRFSDLKTLCRYLALQIEKKFRPWLSVKDFWDDDEGPKMNLMNYIHDALLADREGQIYHLFNEVDRVFPFACRNDFFSALRGWHNERSHNNAWNRLNLVLAHSTEPHLWIADEFQSPFNVGYPILMEDFSPTQVAQLNVSYGSPISGRDLPLFLELTGGHPFLVRQGLFSMHQGNIDMSRFNETAAADNGPFGDHLKSYLWRLHQNRPLIGALRDILRHGACNDEMHFSRIRSAGLVKGETRNAASPRCGLYRRFFGEHL